MGPVCWSSRLGVPESDRLRAPPEKGESDDPHPDTRFRLRGGGSQTGGWWREGRCPAGWRRRRWSVLAGDARPLRETAPRASPARPGDIGRPLPRPVGRDVLRARSLRAADAGAGDPGGGAARADLHHLPRLLPRVVPALAAGERLARDGAR